MGDVAEEITLSGEVKKALRIDLENTPASHRQTVYSKKVKEVPRM